MGCPWRGYQDFSLSLLPGECGERRFAPSHALPWCSTLPQAQSNGVTWLWTKASETLKQNENFFLSSCVSQTYCHSDRKVRFQRCDHFVSVVRFIRVKLIASLSFIFNVHSICSSALHSRCFCDLCFFSFFLHQVS